MEVFKAIVSVTSAMARDGIAKSRKNQQQNYSFRGIDDIYAALSRELANANLCMLPRITSRECVERTTKSGSPLFYTVLTVEFDFVSAVDGSKHTICTVGEAMDSADKSSNKAMSAAYKYAALMSFAIPTEGDNDADAVTHEVASAEDQYKALVLANEKSIDAIKDGIANGQISTAAEAWFTLDQETMQGLWKAPSNGGVFTTQERAIMKTKEFRESYFGVESK